MLISALYTTLIPTSCLDFGSTSSRTSALNSRLTTTSISVNLPTDQTKPVNENTVSQHFL